MLAPPRPNPLENFFLGIRTVAAHLGNEISIRIGEEKPAFHENLNETKAVTRAVQNVSRSDQGKFFAEEEAMLHEQLMIEQEIMLINDQKRWRKAKFEAAKRKQEAQGQAQFEVKRQRQDQEAPGEPNRAKQTEKIESIEQKLSLIRQRLAQKKTDNSKGIATLREAVSMC